MIEYDKDAIVPPYITEYLRAKTVHNDEFMHSLEKYAEENSVPIVEPETARFLSVMCRTVKPKKILEVGCAIGYSSILMAQATDDDCEIATLECNEIWCVLQGRILKLRDMRKKYLLLRQMQRIIFRILTMMKFLI